MSAAVLAFALAMWPFWFALGVCAALAWCERAGHRPRPRAYRVRVEHPLTEAEAAELVARWKSARGRA